MAIENAMQVCARAFFNQLTLGGYKVEFHTQLNNKKIRAIIDEVLAS
jgi:type III restriction enzyme